MFDTLFHPEQYHGPDSWTTSGSKEEGFFEGWYYKLTTASGEIFVAIPGIIYSKADPDGNGGFSFIMTVSPGGDGGGGKYHLYKFPLDSFSSSASAGDGTVSSSTWEVRIGANSFSSTSMTLNLEDTDTDPDTGHMQTHSVEGTVRLTSSQTWPLSALLPDVMGWFAWLPGMECRHGIVSLSSALSGSLTATFTSSSGSGDSGTVTSSNSFSFEQGAQGYVEKDWGSNFPHTWVWMQSNHFVAGAGSTHGNNDNNIIPGTIFFSIATIPLPSEKVKLLEFTGFLAALYLPEHGGLYRFATYTGAVVESMAVNAAQSRVELVIRSAQHRVHITAAGTREVAATLHAPTPGGHFLPLVKEMLDARLEVKLVDRATGSVVFEGVGLYAGLELESIDPNGGRGEQFLKRG